MKSFKKNLLLNESSGRVLVSVDIQPAYSECISFDVREWLKWMADSEYDRYIILWNGPEMGMESEEEYREWLLEHGMEERFIWDAEWIPKVYAFFRSCMDAGYDSDEVSKVVRYMWDNNINDSRDLDDWNWIDLNLEDKDVQYYIKSGAFLYIPEVMSVLSEIHQPIDVVGGCHQQCLEEIRIALKALNKNFRDIEKWIFW